MAQQVDPKMADACVQNYQALYQSPDAGLIGKAYTESASFPLEIVRQFLANTKSCDALVMKFGVYTTDYAKKYSVQAGRMSVFLYTQSGVYGGGYGDDPQDPLNVSDLKPPSAPQDPGHGHGHGH